MQDRVKLVGAVPQQDLPLYYSATDALVLASSREGWANVLLEAMACGTPVVATDIPGTREVVTSAAAGILVARRSPSEIAEGIRSILSALRRREDTRHYAQQFGWQETTAGQLRLWGQVMKANR